VRTCFGRVTPATGVERAGPPARAVPGSHRARSSSVPLHRNGPPAHSATSGSIAAAFTSATRASAAYVTRLARSAARLRPPTSVGDGAASHTHLLARFVVRLAGWNANDAVANFLVRLSSSSHNGFTDGRAVRCATGGWASKRVFVQCPQRRLSGHNAATRSTLRLGFAYTTRKGKARCPNGLLSASNPHIDM
jgi:hypothetical protein